MGISLTTHKRLWGASGMVCAKCKDKVVEPGTAFDDASITGEEAHIVSKKTDGPRFNDPLPMDERDEFENLLILCNRCHKIVDDQKNTYTVAVLRKMKAEHETVVLATFAQYDREKKRDAMIDAGVVNEWNSHQSGKIADYHFSVRIRTKSTYTEYNNAIDRFSEHLHHWISHAFRHTCVSTPTEDFVYILSMERSYEISNAGFTHFELSLFCHITEFVWAFQEWAQFFLDGKHEWKATSRVRSYPGDQTLQLKAGLGRNIAYRIYRRPPGSIQIQQMAGPAFPRRERVTTSTLLCLLSDILNSKPIIWDEADACPDLEKVMSMATNISDRGFSWGDCTLDRRNPERWEYAPQ